MIVWLLDGNKSCYMNEELQYYPADTAGFFQYFMVVMVDLNASQSIIVHMINLFQPLNDVDRC